MKILTVEQMTRVDEESSTRCGIPSLILMENAGVQLYSALLEEFEGELQDLHVVILCGRGNNGGDGLVLARQLFTRSIPVRVFLVGRSDSVGGDAAVNLDIFRRCGGQIVEIAGPEELPELNRAVGEADIVVDALLGTGLTRPVEGLYREAVRAINSCGAFILAVDIPSGMQADAQAGGAECVRADLTVTFTAPKIAHLLNQDQEALGRLKVVTIGSPDFLMQGADFKLSLMDPIEAARVMPVRRTASHKGDYGNLAIVGGSRGKGGAAALAGLAALRSGAGLVTVLVPEPVQLLVASFRPELMTEPLEAATGGGLGRSSLPQLQKHLQGRDAVALGPGLGADPETMAVVEDLYFGLAAPMVVDADGLNALAAGAKLSHTKPSGPRVLTPHPGEFSRLSGHPMDLIRSQGFRLACEFAQDHQVWLILKGFRTLLATPEGQVSVCPFGNPGMATAGMGDVLTGVLVSLMALFQSRGRLSDDGIRQALEIGILVHSLAGDLALEDEGPEALLAGSVIDALGLAFDQLETAQLPWN